MQSLANKRILIFLRSFEIGGAERQAAMLANYLVNHEKAKVSVWAYSKPGPILDLLDKKISWKSVHLDMENLKPENLSKRKKDLWKLALSILRIKPHVILPFTVTPNTDCGYIWKLAGAKTCIWNQRDEWLNFLDKEIEKQAFEDTLVFVSNSKKGKELISENLRGGHKKVYFIPNAVELDPPQKTRSEWRKELKIKEKTLLATMVANLTENKDHETLLKAWKIVIDKTKTDNKPILALAGRFDWTQNKLKKLAKELKIENQVHFLGFVQDVSGLLKASDIALFTSKSEGSPNGILEPMAAKLPIISYRIKGVEDILGKNYPLYAPVGNAEKISELVLKVINNPEERREIGIKNYNKVTDQFKPEITFKKYSDVISRALTDSKINIFTTIKEFWKFRKIIKQINKAEKNLINK